MPRAIILGVGPSHVTVAEGQRLAFSVSTEPGRVSALMEHPANAKALLVLGHGAGADMLHAGMESLAQALHRHGVATFRYQFPYSERARTEGRRRPPNRSPQLVETVRCAVETAAEHAGGLPLLAGGKSMGGRMTSLAQAESPLPGVRGLVFFGFPLHPAGKPSAERGAHLDSVEIPLLFLQGTRDRMAMPELLHPLCERLGARAHLHWVEDGDHSFAVRKRSGRTPVEVQDELGDQVLRFANRFA